MSKHNISSLTGLRGLAAWWVVFYHFREAMGRDASQAWFDTLLAHGYLAVDLFFILSGFVIAYNYAQFFTRLEFAELYLFYSKRIARIYPLHIFLLVLFIINPVALHLFSNSGETGSRYSYGYFLQSVLLIQNWGFAKELAWNVPAWSISTELAAYLLFPLVIHFLKKMSVLFLVLGYAVFLTTLYLIFHYNALDSLGHEIARLGLYRCVLQFFMGAVLCLLWVRFFESREWISMAGLLIALILALTFWLVGGLSSLVFVPLVFTCAILYVLNERSLGANLLSRPSVAYLGEISYSTYLVHYFVKDWVKFLSDDLGLLQFFVYGLVVLVASIFLYHFIETPYRSRTFRMLQSGKQRVGE
jgi:peptidoglycan/LPS O-acetylase OafA/YrhL